MYAQQGHREKKKHTHTCTKQNVALANHTSKKNKNNKNNSSNKDAVTTRRDACVQTYIHIHVHG